MLKEAKSLEDISHYLNLMRNSLNKSSNGGASNPAEKKRLDDLDKLNKAVDQQLANHKKLKKDEDETVKTNKTLIPSLKSFGKGMIVAEIAIGVLADVVYLLITNIAKSYDSFGNLNKEGIILTQNINGSSDAYKNLATSVQDTGLTLTSFVDLVKNHAQIFASVRCE